MAEYVDKESLIKQFTSYGAYCCYGESTVKAIVSRIEIQAAADVAEVKRGSWCLVDNYYDIYKCSICDTTTQLMTNYCSNCGAKMEVQA